jgi:hypothetical protein
MSCVALLRLDAISRHIEHDQEIASIICDHFLPLLVGITAANESHQLFLE